MTQAYWIKFFGVPPERWVRTSFEEFWYDLRERILREHLKLEWIILD